MRAPLSIVIPTYRAADQLPATLACLMEGLEAGLLRELILSDALLEDGAGDAATARIASDTGARLVLGAPGRGGQLRRGAAAARGDWLLFLHADTHLAPGWSEAVRAHLSTPQRAAHFRLAFRGGGRWAAMVAGWANLRARWGLPFGDQGLLISRRLYDEIGGYPDIALMEDLAIARALSGRLRGLPVRAETDPARYQQGGWLRQGARNMWRQLRFLAGADPERLARQYTRPGARRR